MVSYVYENTPDMVFVTESWVNENTMDSELALNGYVTRRKDRKDRRGGGGLIYATEEVSAQCDIDLSDCNEEILWCRLAEGNILAGVCYNSTSNMQEEEAKIHSNIIQAYSRMSNKEVLLCGDFNHNTINWKELEATAEGQSFLDLTQDLGLIQPVETATRHGMC